MKDLPMPAVIGALAVVIAVAAFFFWRAYAGQAAPPEPPQAHHINVLQKKPAGIEHMNPQEAQKAFEGGGKH